MTRLVTFGCSLTYGTALEDPNDAWPNQLSSKWNLELVNMGISGASTKRIWWEIVNFNFQKTDIVFVLWTHMDRWCILKEDNNHIEWDIPGKIKIYPGYPHKTDQRLLKTQEAYYKYMHDDFDMLTQYLTYINNAYFYLKNKVTNQYHIRASQPDKNLPFNQVDFLPIDLDSIRGNYPKATDNQHPGKEAYQEFVKQIDNFVD